MYGKEKNYHSLSPSGGSRIPLTLHSGLKLDSSFSSQLLSQTFSSESSSFRVKGTLVDLDADLPYPTPTSSASPFHSIPKLWPKLKCHSNKNSRREFSCMYVSVVVKFTWKHEHGFHHFEKGQSWGPRAARSPAYSQPK